MNDPDIRWKQRFRNYQKAYAQLEEACELRRRRALSRLEKQGLIQVYEYTYELGWNTLKDYLNYQGIVNIVGSRDTIRESFSRELIADGEGWIDMLIDRNKTSHTYNEETAEEIVQNICEKHLDLLTALKQKMAALDSEK